MPHVYHFVRFPEEAVAVLEEWDLPVGWNDRPGSTGSAVVGDEWLQLRQSLVLAVPCVVVPPELWSDPASMNYVINPVHDDYGGMIESGGIHDLGWDPRSAT